MGQTQAKEMQRTTITHDAIAAFKQHIEDTEVNTQPLITASLPFEGLMVEFESGDKVFTEKLVVKTHQCLFSTHNLEELVTGF
jgi:hypothetical protein